MAKATPEQILLFGQGAAAIRVALDRKGWGPADLNEAMGRDRTNGGVYSWLNATKGLTASSRALVSKALGIPESDLMAADEDAAASTRNTAPVPRNPAPVPRRIRTASDIITSDILSFAVDDQGRARIRCDLLLPLEKGTTVLQLLLGAGLSLGE